jgi:chromate transporter
MVRIGSDGSSTNRELNPRPIDLFLAFLRLGLTAFGGPAMVAYIGDLSVKRKKWLDQETFKNGVVLCQSIPGATAIQVAAYVGLQTRGVVGALASYVGFALPAFVLMLALSSLYAVSKNLPWVAALFAGLQVIVVAIVANATFTFGKTSLINYKQVFVAAGSALAFGLGLSPFYVILGAALCGVLVLGGKPLAEPVSNQDKTIPTTTPLFALVGILAAGLLLLYLLRPALFGLALLMLKIDLFAFGGGFASIPLMLQEVVNVRGWLDSKTFIDGIALGQVTPGPIVITATFVGYLVHGLPGALVATIAIFAPSFLLLVGTAPFFHRLKQSSIFARVTRGILASFVGLLLYVTVRFALAVPWDILRVCLVAAALIALLRKVDLLYIVLIGAAISVALF